MHVTHSVKERNLDEVELLVICVRNVFDGIMGEINL